MTVEPIIKCSDEQNTVFGTDIFCGLIRNASGPFNHCISGGFVNVAEFYDSCIMDACAYVESRDMSEVICNALEDFAEECEENGYRVTWRSDDVCRKCILLYWDPYAIIN